MADLEQRRHESTLVAERTRSDLPVGRPDHGRELHGERRHVRGGEASRVDRQTRRDRSGIWLRTASAWLVLTPVESAEAPKQEHEIVMLLNFFDELRRKVPVGK